jgi:hypothetical protein
MLVLTNFVEMRPKPSLAGFPCHLCNPIFMVFGCLPSKV